MGPAKSLCSALTAPLPLEPLLYHTLVQRVQSGTDATATTTYGEGGVGGKLAGFRLAGNDKQLALRRTVSVFYLVERQRERKR